MAQVLSTPDAVIAAIQARHEAELTLAWILVRKFDPDLTHAAERHFDTWGAAVLAAGLDLDLTHSSGVGRGKPFKKVGFKRPLATPRRVQPKSSRLSALTNEESVWWHFRKPGNKGLSWWRLLGSEEKKDVVRELIEKGMSTTAISEYLELESRNRVAGVRDRLKYPQRGRNRSSGRKSKGPTMWSLDAPITRDAKQTRHNFVGAEDPGFAKMESQQLLQALLDKRKLADDVVTLLKRLILGDDLEDAEYRRLASAIRQHTDLMEIVQHL